MKGAHLQCFLMTCLISLFVIIIISNIICLPIPTRSLVTSAERDVGDSVIDSRNRHSTFPGLFKYDKSVLFQQCLSFHPCVLVPSLHIDINTDLLRLSLRWRLGDLDLLRLLRLTGERL